MMAYLQLLVNFIDVQRINFTPCPFTVLSSLKDVVYFKITQNPEAAEWISKHIMPRADRLQKFITKQDTMVIAVAFFAPMLILLAVLGVACSKFKFVQKLKDRFMWTPVILVLLQTYFPTCLNSFTSLRDDPKDPSLFKVAINLGLLLFVPLFSFGLLSNWLEKTVEENFKKRYGQLYPNIRPEKEGLVIRTPLFCVIRILIGVVTIFSNEITFAVVVTYLFSSLVASWYILSYKPMVTKRQNRLELFNGVSLLASTYFAMMFSGPVESLEAQRTLGYLFTA
jgi:hypothetical protein